MTARDRAAATLAVLLLSTVPLLPASAVAQPTSEEATPGWAGDPFGEIAFLTINGAIGGLTAGLWRELSGGSFGDAFAEGAIGGSVVYAGKRLAAESFVGAGLVGRGLASVGSSVVRNAADGRDPMDRVVLPLGPLRLYASTDDLAHPRLEVDLRDLYWTVYGTVEDRLTLDLGESLSSGAPVFRSEVPLQGSDDEIVGGLTSAGVIFLGPEVGAPEAQTEVLLPHERAHVIQHDFTYHVWLRPLEDRLARLLPARGFSDRVDYDLVYPTLASVASALGWIDRFHAPGEAEADFLGTR